MKLNNCLALVAVLVPSTLIAGINLPAAAQQFRSGSNVVKITRVRGWEAQIVAGTPNLARYYWEPMTRRTILTTHKTGRQANHIPLPTKNVTMRPNKNEDQCITSAKLACRSLPSARVAPAASLASTYTTADTGTAATLSCLKVNAQLAHHTKSKNDTGLIAQQQSLAALNRK